MYANVGSTFIESEKCPEGTYTGHIHAFRCIGKHLNKFRPDNPPAVQGIFGIELDCRDSKGKRFLKYKRETWSVHKKSNLRTKWGLLIPEAFEWTDNDWARKDLHAIWDGLPCLVKIGDQGGIMAVRPLPTGRQPLEPELSWPDVDPDDVFHLVTKLRYGDEPDRAEDYEVTKARFMEPIPAKPGQVKVKPDPVEQAAAADDWDGQF